jgi:hypothetical protein
MFNCSINLITNPKPIYSHTTSNYTTACFFILKEQKTHVGRLYSILFLNIFMMRTDFVHDLLLQKWHCFPCKICVIWRVLNWGLGFNERSDMTTTGHSPSIGGDWRGHSIIGPLTYTRARQTHSSITVLLITSWQGPHRKHRSIFLLPSNVHCLVVCFEVVSLQRVYMPQH